MKRFQSICIVMIVVLLGVDVSAQNGRPALPANGTAEIDAILQHAVQQGTVPGVVAIVANKDRILYQGAFGLMDVGKQRPISRDAIFRIASMTKPVTSAAVMMLA